MAEAIREVVSTSILFDVSDPRVRGITVLRVEVSSDLRSAIAFVSVMGTETQQKLAMSGLRHATGFLQAKMANRLQTRFTPVLTFKVDESIKKSVEISRIIDDALASDLRHESDDDEADNDEDKDDGTGLALEGDRDGGS